MADSLSVVQILVDAGADIRAKNQVRPSRERGGREGVGEEGRRIGERTNFGESWQPSGVPETPLQRLVYGGLLLYNVCFRVLGCVFG